MKTIPKYIDKNRQKDNMYKPKDFAELIGVSVKTLQRWDNDGILVAKRNPKNRRYYTQEQLMEYLNISKTTDKIVIYSRVSTSNQKQDLENQIDFLKQFANAKGMIVSDVYTDIGSGLNYNRKMWNKLIKECMEGRVKTIIISNKDRFIRFGFDWYESLLKDYGTNIIIVNNESMSPQEEMIQDLISIIHVFSCKVYGLRKYKKAILNENVTNIQDRD